MYPRTSLLGLPNEIRQLIYDLVTTIDLNCQVISKWKDSHESATGFQARPVYQNVLRIPWLSLRLTCKTIADELRLSQTQSTDSTTWKFELAPHASGRALGPMTWHQIPCAPGDVRRIDVMMSVRVANTRRLVHWWGDGGPMGITRALYQVLNHLVHCGPRMVSTTELSKPLHVKELVVRIEDTVDGRKYIPEEFEDEDSYADYSVKRQMSWLEGFVQMISREGMSYGFVDRFVVQMDGSSHVFEVEDPGHWVLPQSWERYGFDWGMAPYKEVNGRENIATE